MTVVTRFPPSPTGFMHIGNARTALFNYLYARHCGGKFLLRIEDTDRARHSEDAVQVILNGLDWMGLSYDNEPVSQYAQRQRHADIAEQLLAAGQAYRCYCTAEELEAMREEAKKEGRPVAYDRRWRDAPADAPKPEGVKPVIRIKAPLTGDSVVEDEVQGRVTVRNDQIDDFIILRSDGVPTYMLAVVVDDHDMGVTHVIRGDDHLNNTFRQNVLYDALGWDKPVYAHMPLILGPDGAKLSKRHGAQSVEDFRALGYLPEALNNYLMRLGWSHGDDEIFSMDQAVQWFDIKDVNKGASKFDFDKLNNVNAHYIKISDEDRLATLLEPFLTRIDGVVLDNKARTRLKTGMADLKERGATLVQLAEEAAFYAKAAPLSKTEKAQKILDEAEPGLLEALATRLAALPSFTAEDIENACRALAQDYSGKLGKVMMPLRAALTGTDKSPPLFHAAEILGREEVLARLKG